MVFALQYIHGKIWLANTSMEKPTSYIYVAMDTSINNYNKAPLGTITKCVDHAGVHISSRAYIGMSPLCQYT